MSEFTGAIDYFVDRSRVFQNQNSHRAIVLHGTGGNAAQTARQLGDWFRTNPGKASTNYGIDRAGEIAQYVLEQDGAAGNCCLDGNYDPFWNQFGGDNLNLHTLSVETVNDSANSLPLTDPQKQTLFKLVKYWVDKYHIPISNIKSHASLDAVNRQRCPGPNFPWDELFNYLATGGTTMAVPAGWKDANNILTAPNGIPVAFGFRDYILKIGWDPNNWPLTREYSTNPIEQSNPGLGGGSAQEFRWKRLTYAQGRVFEGWIGQELAWYQKMLPQLTGQVAQLKTENAQLKDKVLLLQKQLDANQVIPQSVKEDILILGGNIDKLKQDAGLTI